MWWEMRSYQLNFVSWSIFSHNLLMSSTLIFFLKQLRLITFYLEAKLITSDETLISKLWGIAMYNMVLSIVKMFLAFFLLLILFNFVTFANKLPTVQNFLKHVQNKCFLWKLWAWLLPPFPEATMNLPSIGVLWTFCNQYISQLF